MKRRPMTAAEARLIEAAIKERAIREGYDDLTDEKWPLAWQKYRAAVFAVVKERKKP